MTDEEQTWHADRVEQTQSIGGYVAAVVSELDQDDEDGDTGEIPPDPIQQWEFLEQPPTSEAVIALLATLPPVHGIRPVDYAAYVTAIEGSKKYEVDMPDRPGVKETRRMQQWSLYFTVAGRLKMIDAAAALHGWRVDFELEQDTPSGVPGWLEPLDSPRIVQRVYCVIYERRTQGRRDEWFEIARRSGTSWAPRSGGKGASENAPFENVETSAIGRAIAMHGFGVLPGSGVASVEEIRAVAAREKQQSQPARRGRARTAAPDDDHAGGEPDESESREDVAANVTALVETLSQLRGKPWEESMAGVADWLKKRDARLPANFHDERTGAIDFGRVKPGLVLLLRNTLREQIVQARADTADL